MKETDSHNLNRMTGDRKQACLQLRRYSRSTHGIICLSVSESASLTWTVTISATSVETIHDVADIICGVRGTILLIIRHHANSAPRRFIKMKRQAGENTEGPIS